MHCWSLSTTLQHKSTRPGLNRCPDDPQWRTRAIEEDYLVFVGCLPVSNPPFKRIQTLRTGRPLDPFPSPYPPPRERCIQKFTNNNCIMRWGPILLEDSFVKVGRNLQFCHYIAARYFLPSTVPSQKTNPMTPVQDKPVLGWFISLDALWVDCEVRLWR